MKEQNKQGGFTLIEGSLVLFALMIIGGAAYYVFSAQQSTNKSFSNMTNINDVSENKPIKKTTGSVTAEKTAPPVSNENKNPGYLVISEWGVALRIGDKAHSDKLTYRIAKDTYGDDTAYILLKEDISKNCREVGFALHKSNSPSSKYIKIGSAGYAPSAAQMSMCDKYPNETKAIEVLNSLSGSINAYDYEIKAAL